MGAIYLLKNLIVLEPSMNRLETAQNVLNELIRQRNLNTLPYFAVRRAINIQRRVIKKIDY